MQISLEVFAQNLTRKPNETVTKFNLLTTCKQTRRLQQAQLVSQTELLELNLQTTHRVTD